MDDKEISNRLAPELLKGFHTQFAENQRTREQSFLKIVGFLGAVILGYAYVFRNFSDDVYLFSYSAIASVVVLFFGSAIVTVIAYSFRRDQYVNARIRKKAGIMGIGRPFPLEYDPAHLYQDPKFFRQISVMFFWMPDIFFFFFWLFPVFQVLILISYSAKNKLILSLSQSTPLATWTVVVSILSVLLSLSVVVRFGAKLKGKVSKWENESKEATEHESVPTA